MMNNTVFALHKFTNLNEDMSFQPYDYSRLKFGDRQVAEAYGESLAINFFKSHSSELLTKQCVVIPSPYNYVKNAASVMAEFFYHKLNQLMVSANGNNVEFDIIHRKVSYTADYGFLPKDARAQLLSNDEFSLNEDFLAGKTLIFIDDVKITGTHEDKLVELIDDYDLYTESHYFLYFAQYFGDSPEIESRLNFSAIAGCEDVISMLNRTTTELIIRPIKYIMGLDEIEFKASIGNINLHRAKAIYNACLAEGYFKIPKYQTNFQILHEMFVDN